MATDRKTLSLFDPGNSPTPGSLACSIEIAHTMSDAIKQSPHDRIDITARMTRFLGREVSLGMLNSYTAESRDTHNISLERAIAFDVATERYALLRLHAAKCGAQVLLGDEVLMAELGRVSSERRELEQKERALRTLLRGRK